MGVAIGSGLGKKSQTVSRGLEKLVVVATLGLVITYGTYTFIDVEGKSIRTEDAGANSSVNAGHTDYDGDHGGQKATIVSGENGGIQGVLATTSERTTETDDGATYIFQYQLLKGGEVIGWREVELDDQGRLVLSPDQVHRLKELGLLITEEQKQQMDQLKDEREMIQSIEPKTYLDTPQRTIQIDLPQQSPGGHGFNPSNATGSKPSGMRIELGPKN